MPESTLQAAIEELHNVVNALNELLTREYPRRDEIENKFREQEMKAVSAFVDKKVAHQRWIIVLLLGPLLVAGTFFMTIGTISSCFLGRTSTHPPGVCGVIPGYVETRERQTDFNELVRELVKLNKDHEDRLDNLEESRR